jgi:hypothetical protein
VVVASSFVAVSATAQDLVQTPPPAVSFDDPGHFEVREARTDLVSGVYLLTAEIDYRLSTEARDALQAGVPLVIRLDAEIIHPRRWWFDNDAAALRQSYQLEYHALSERYLVLNVNTSEQTSFGTLSAALESLGSLRRFPLIDAAVLEDQRGYDVRLRALLDQEQFPGPLRLLAFWRRDWSIASDWYRWPLVNE